MKKQMVLGSMLSIALLFSGAIYAQKPAENISARKHPNLAAAQRMCREAYDKIVAGQQANEWDLEGHAAKAKDLLDQASNELKQAAEAANHNHH
jgi:major membrane immunogen (membrane-anchored lipoprotein)